jgi:hypothetical protein
LNLSSNQLAALPESIGDCAHLETLNLSGNRIDYVPDSVGKLTQLRQLFLTGNRLRTLPESIGNLQNLELLSLDHNQLESLPESISALKLGSLLLANNRLTRLPDTLARMSELTWLDLSNNPLESLPDGLRLNWLDLSGCTRLRTLPANLTVLGHMEVSGTSLRPPPASVQIDELTWRGVQIDWQIAFAPESITYRDVIKQRNVETRRIMLERLGLDAFVAQADSQVLDKDRDRGGKRFLLLIQMPDDEPIVCLVVRCPSTRHEYVLRVPPTTRSCKQGAAWIAGFDRPEDYRPILET